MAGLIFTLRFSPFDKSLSVYQIEALSACGTARLEKELEKE
jgi:hypothetical protein